MITIEPKLYKDFKCSASKCSLTCCQEWKISVDGDTYIKWRGQGLNDEIEDRANAVSTKKPVDGTFSDYVTEVDESDVICLNSKRKCPFLNGNKLCNIVIKHGDAMIPETCRVFPREKHEHGDRIELALSPGCPEVLNLLWSADNFELNKALSDGDNVNDILLDIREWLIDIMKDNRLSITSCLEIIFLILLDLSELEQSNSLDDEFDYYKVKTDIREIAKAIGDNSFMTAERFIEYNELLIDITERYHAKGMYADFLSLVVEEALRISDEYEYQDGIKDDWNSFSEELTEWNQYFRLLLIEEIYSALGTSDVESVSDMLVKLQWLVMEYVVILQSLFLRRQKGIELTYDNVRESTCIIFRIMGFSDDDIFEYMESSFEELVWPWGYFSLLI